MLTLFSLLLVLAAAYYALLIGLFAFGFRRVRREALVPSPSPRGPVPPFVSVVVAARNEATTIESCLRSILANDYPSKNYEVIVVDDFSDDETAACVARVQRTRGPAAAPVHLIRMREEAVAATGHKRHALLRGIAAARGDLILTTDADCTVSPGWIQRMTACFTPDTGFVAGPVRYRPGTFLFGRFQALEFLGLVAIGAGGIGLGRPNMCNSANVAYRRDVHAALSLAAPDAPVLPGDDEVLAQRLAAETDWQVRFCAAPEALVETDPLVDLRAFWAQRRRWAGTGPRYPSKGLVAAILAAYLFYVLLLAGLLILPFVPSMAGPVALALGLKIVPEAALLYPACRHFEQRRLFRYFLPEQVLQIPYVVTVGLAAAVSRPRWKGRRVF